MSSPKRLVLFATGGTISMRPDATGAAVPVLRGADLLRQYPQLENVATVDVVEFSLVGGPQLTPSMVFELARQVEAALDEGRYDGAVVTQGTDTLEEASFMLDLLLRTDKPVVYTAAMRDNADLSADGPRNLFGALITAAAEQARGMGVLVVAGDRIFAAVDVMKTHTLDAATFQAPGRGPLGCVLPARKRVVFFHRPLLRQTLPASGVCDNVPIVTAALGLGPELLHAAVAGGASGIVIEALGAGNLPPQWQSAVAETVAAGVPVVLASRCPAGTALDLYGYPGGGRRLVEAGAILAQGLSPAKARIKLMLALSVSRELDYLRTVFEYLF